MFRLLLLQKSSTAIDGVDTPEIETPLFVVSATICVCQMRDNFVALWQNVDMFGINDTHRFVTDLAGSGFTNQQAEGLTDALRKIDLSHLATKDDINELKNSIEKLEMKLTIRLGSLIAAGVAFLAFLKIFE